MPNPESLHNSHAPERTMIMSSSSVGELLLTCSATTAGIMGTASGLEDGLLIQALICGTIGVLSGKHLYHLLRGNNTKKQAAQEV